MFTFHFGSITRSLSPPAGSPPRLQEDPVCGKRDQPLQRVSDRPSPTFACSHHTLVIYSLPSNRFGDLAVTPGKVTVTVITTACLSLCVVLLLAAHILKAACDFCALAERLNLCSIFSVSALRPRPSAIAISCVQVCRQTSHFAGGGEKCVQRAVCARLLFFSRSEFLF